MATRVVQYFFDFNWNDDGTTFVNEKDYALTFRISRGRDDELGAVKMGTATIVLDNFTGRFTPEYTAGPLYGNLENLRRMRVRATWSAVTYDLFYGYITRIQPDVKAKTVTIEAADLFITLANHELNLAGVANQRVDQRVADILGDVGVAAGDQVLSTCHTTLPFAHWRNVDALSAIQEAVDHELGGMFFMRGDGKAILHDRHFRALSSSAATFTTPGDIDYDRRQDNVYHRVVLQAGSFENGVAGSQIWSYSPLPLALAPGEVLKLNPNYNTPASNVTTPVSGTDWIANRASDGSGLDETALVASSGFQDFSGGATWTLTNNAAVTVYLTKLQIRGTPKGIAADLREISRTASGGVGVYKTKTFKRSYPLITDKILLGDFADYIVTHYNAPQPMLSVILRPDTDATLTQMLARDLDQRVTVVDTAQPYRTNVNGDWFIESIEESCDVRENHLVTRWRLTDFLADQFWIMDTSALDVDALPAY